MIFFPIRETSFEIQNNTMSDSNTKSKDFSTREDKIIKSTLILCDDNKRKMSIVEKLKFCIEKIEGLRCDNVTKLDITNDLELVISSIKKSYNLSKHHLKQVNLSANQTEETYERISKRTKNASADVARILFNMQNNHTEKSNNIRLTIPNFTAAGDNPIEQHIDTPRPKHDFYKPKELWDTFNDIKFIRGYCVLLLRFFHGQHDCS